MSAEDREAHAQAFVVSSIAEHSLPFTMSPHLIRFAQTLSSDSRTLQNLCMSRMTAAYKLREGLAANINEDLVELLRNTHFSINVDECMSNNYEKVFSVLVSFFSEEQISVVVQHYKSKSFTVVNAKKLYNFVIDTLEADGIQLTNLISTLSDSTNYMRGKAAGFETLMRKAAPHLLDIDGDTCQHAHNTAGKFLKPFGRRVESLCSDTRTDMQWSTDFRDFLRELCEILGINFRMPATFVQRRWLSAFDAADVDIELLPAFTVLYFAWVEKDLKETYKDDIDHLLEGISEKSKACVEIIWSICQKKSLTHQGLDRKKRIVDKLFYTRIVTDLHFNLYISVLPLIKSFVLMFEQKEPMIHRLFDELKVCMRSFLASFIKVDNIAYLTAKNLSLIDATDRSLQKQFKEWNIGRKCQKI